MKLIHRVSSSKLKVIFFLYKTSVILERKHWKHWTLNAKWLTTKTVFLVQLFQYTHLNRTIKLCIYKGYVQTITALERKPPSRGPTIHTDVTVFYNSIWMVSFAPFYEFCCFFFRSSLPSLHNLISWVYILNEPVPDQSSLMRCMVLHMMAHYDSWLVGLNHIFPTVLFVLHKTYWSIYLCNMLSGDE